MTSSAAEIDSVRRAWRDRLLCALVPHAVHRLGNLLTVVSGTAELLALESAGVDDKERTTGLGNITAQSARAHAMIRALGHHARTLRGAPAAIDLHELVQSQYELLAPVSKAVGLPLEVLPSNGMTVARADSGQSLAGRPIKEVVTVNGARVILDNGSWGLVRASSNTPNLVVVCESSESEAEMRAIFADIDAVIRTEPGVGEYDQTI